MLLHILGGGRFQLGTRTGGRTAAGSLICNAHSAYGWSWGVPLWSLAPEDEEITGFLLCYAGYREGGGNDSCLTYTSRYFFLHRRPGILVENLFQTIKAIAELGEENVVGLIIRTLFITGRVVTLRGMKSPVACRFQLGIRIPTTTSGP